MDNNGYTTIEKLLAGANQQYTENEKSNVTENSAIMTDSLPTKTDIVLAETCSGGKASSYLEATVGTNAEHTNKNKPWRNVIRRRIVDG